MTGNLKINGIIFLAALWLITMPLDALKAQSVGLNNSSPNASAILDAVSTSQGVLVPRMTSAQRDAIASPATGLLVYVTDLTSGFWYYDGTQWVTMYARSTIIIKRKTTDEIISGTGSAQYHNTGTTLLNDSELVVPLQANKTYTIDGFLWEVVSGGGGNMNIAFTIPAGSNMVIAYQANEGNDNTSMGTSILTSSGTASNKITCATAAKNNPVFISGTVVMSGTAGNLTLQWSQNTNDNANTLTLKAGSYLRAILAQ